MESEKKKLRKKSSYQVSVKLVIKPMFKQLWLANSNTSRRCNEEAELHNGSYVWREDVEGVELIIIRWKNSGWSCINRYKDTEKLHWVWRGRHIPETRFHPDRYSHSAWLNLLSMEKEQMKIMLKDMEWKKKNLTYLCLKNMLLF